MTDSKTHTDDDPVSGELDYSPGDRDYDPDYEYFTGKNLPVGYPETNPQSLQYLRGGENGVWMRSAIAGKVTIPAPPAAAWMHGVGNYRVLKSDLESAPAVDSTTDSTSAADAEAPVVGITAKEKIDPLWDRLRSTESLEIEEQTREEIVFWMASARISWFFTADLQAILLNVAGTLVVIELGDSLDQSAAVVNQSAVIKACMKKNEQQAVDLAVAAAREVAKGARDFELWTLLNSDGIPRRLRTVDVTKWLRTQDLRFVAGQRSSLIHRAAARIKAAVSWIRRCGTGDC